MRCAAAENLPGMLVADVPTVIRHSLARTILAASLAPHLAGARDAEPATAVVAAPHSKQNLPPKLSDQGPRHERLPTRPEEALRIPLYANDPDGETLHFSVSGMPSGATLEQPQENGSPATVVWPSPVSGVFMLDVRVTDPSGGSDSAKVKVIVEEEWNSGFLPGAGYTAYAPAEGGYLQGPRLEIVFFSWIHRNDNRGPSHGRIALDLDLLFPQKGKSVFAPALAFDLSFERNPQRRFLIPTFGLASGAILPTGRSGAASVTPTLGLHLYASPNVFVHAEGGYVLPLRPTVFDEYRGARGALVVDFTMW